MPTITDKRSNSTSIGIRLYGGWGDSLASFDKIAKPTEIYNLQEIPDLSNTDGETDTIEITVLSDTYHEFADGLKNYAEDGELSFKFLYTAQGYYDLNELLHSEPTDGGNLYWFVKLPDGSYFVIKGSSASLVLDGVGVNAAITFTLNVVPTGTIEYVYKDDEGNIFA